MIELLLLRTAQDQLNAGALLSSLTQISQLGKCVQVKYKNVMQQYGLGPNGGILTSLNLFATKFDQASIAPLAAPCAQWKYCDLWPTALGSRVQSLIAGPC